MKKGRVARTVLAVVTVGTGHTFLTSTPGRRHAASVSPLVGFSNGNRPQNTHTARESERARVCVRATKFGGPPSAPHRLILLAGRGLYTHGAGRSCSVRLCVVLSWLRSLALFLSLSPSLSLFLSLAHSPSLHLDVLSDEPVFLRDKKRAVGRAEDCGC